MQDLLDVIIDFLSSFKWRTAVMIVAGVAVLISGFNDYFVIGFFSIALVLYSLDIWRFMGKTRKLNNPFK
ncbi:hypothetical protein ACON3F_17325 [Providencia hangzhouensis]|uniref:Uncharacterized protein n=1 Tax=Providencia rettgeri TaxID=587 RepID=A0AAW6UGV1_PRORE|nr:MULTISPECIES: hypothetical protein [Providencia]MRF68254.1 hypothetical protein [Escherichia coli]QIF67160.1 hypothetical protein FVA72_17340 [Providencia sp. 1709051003]MBG5894245.1 hypothetical protein [Providencia rettgeri]MBN6367176.1 hypothetical protein [Providencia rettgeri]MBO1928518.1 hypothetical protein [Providencia rettgeri]